MLRAATFVLALVLAAPLAHADCPVTTARLAGQPVQLTLVPDCSGLALSLTEDSRTRIAESLRDQHHDAIVMRNTGIAITAVGTISTVVGAVLFVKNLCFDDCRDSQTDTGIDAGIGLLTVGQVASVVGISLWATGGVRAGKAERALLNVSASGARLTF